jgi:hypothetical protein
VISGFMVPASKAYNMAGSPNVSMSNWQLGSSWDSAIARPQLRLMMTGATRAGCLGSVISHVFESWIFWLPPHSSIVVIAIPEFIE